MKHLNLVEGEYPDLTSNVVVTDLIERPVKETDLVWIHPSPGLLFSAHHKDRSSVEDYGKHFKMLDYQVGAVFMINGEVVGLDSFGKPDSFSKVFKNLVGRYAKDAVHWLDPGKESEAPKTHATRFMEALRNYKWRHALGWGGS